jgi:hypothetical protein
MDNNNLVKYKNTAITHFKNALHTGDSYNLEYYFYNMLTWIGVCLEEKRKKPDYRFSDVEKGLVSGFRHANNTFKHENTIFDLKAVNKEKCIAIWSSNVGMNNRYKKQIAAYNNVLADRNIEDTVKKISKIIDSSLLLDIELHK